MKNFYPMAWLESGITLTWTERKEMRLSSAAVAATVLLLAACNPFAKELTEGDLTEHLRSEGFTGQQIIAILLVGNRMARENVCGMKTEEADTVRVFIDHGVRQAGLTREIIISNALKFSKAIAAEHSKPGKKEEFCKG